MIFKKKYSNTTVYLKINTKKTHSMLCLEKWIRIFEILNYTIFIICDHNSIKKEILKKINKNKNIYIIPSIRNKYLSKITDKIVSQYWKNCTLAQLTCFYHSKIHKINNFWNIDADDTYCCINDKDIANALLSTEKYADDKNINSISLDMHTSRSNGKHWSFGVNYTKNNIDWFNILNNKNWKIEQEQFKKYDNNINLDWFFTYIRNNKIANIENFYIDNMLFIHFGDFLLNPIGASIWSYKNNKIIYPILKYVFENEKLSEVNICSSSTCIYSVQHMNSVEYLNTQLAHLNNISSLWQNNMINKEI